MRCVPSTAKIRAVIFCTLAVLLAQAVAEQPWVEVRSRHFSLMTDGGEKRGRAALLRFEQMRAAFAVIFQRATVNIPVPLQIIAFNSSKELKQYAPLWKGKPIDLAGFFQGSSDRNFIALDLSSESGWGVVFHEYAHMLLNANIPPAPVWFDEGYAEYFSTLKIDDKYISFGLVPEHLAEVLSSRSWMKSADLFSVEHNSKEYNDRDRRSIFYAQSWLTVHYFLNQRKGEQLGTYLALATNHVPAPEAIKKAFGMDPAELDRTLHQYAQGRGNFFRAPAPPDIEGGPYEVHPLSSVEVQAVLADLHAHSLDYRAQGIEEFKKVLQQDPDNGTANRGLGYALLQQNEFDAAAEHLRRAAAKDTGDSRLHYFNALLMQRRSAFQGERLEQIGEIRSELQKALTIDPNYADAYSLLALTDSARGDHKAALEHARKAVDLNPRDEYLRSNLAMAQLRAEDWDAAADTLTQLKSSTNQQIAAQAERNLRQLQTLREQQHKIVEFQQLHAAEEAQAEAHEGEEKKAPAAPATPPRLVVKYLKARLVSVDCTNTPGAVLNLESQGKALKIRVADRNSLVLIGADKFSCEWKNRQVGVNYRPSAEVDGQAITLELQ